MIRRPGLALPAAFFSLASAVVSADVTFKSTMTMAGPATVEMTSTLYLKGTKIRTDMKGAGQEMSVIVDTATKEQLLVNHGTKQVETFDPAAAMAAMPIEIGEVTVSLKPTGEKKVILGRNCQGFALAANMPMTVSGETINVAMSGPVWIVAEGPEVSEYQRFFKEAAAAGGVIATPLAQGPQGKGLVTMQNAIAALGIPLEQEMRVSIEGGGQMAAMMRQMAVSMKTTVTDLSAAPVPDDVFAVPAGYTRKQERP